MTIQKVLVIPAYKEYEALPFFLSEIFELIDNCTQVLIADDSPEEKWDDIMSACKSATGEKYNQLVFSFSKVRNGRGGAVRRGFQKALKEYPSAFLFLECDADGSHRPIDIINILNCENKTNVVIGSRYLEKSEIIGWPISRRIFSRFLNFIIPRIMHLEVSDITNGLRLYDLQSIKVILSKEQQNTGFIYLTEQMINLKDADLTFSEIPICFINRIVGESSVGIREINNSLTGLCRLFHSQFREKKSL